MQYSIVLQLNDDIDQYLLIEKGAKHFIYITE